MDDEAESLARSCSQLFKSGEMRGLALLLRANDDAGKKALNLFLEWHSEAVANMLEGKPTELGLTFPSLISDAHARREENTSRFKHNQNAALHRVGRIMVLAGAASDLVGPTAAIRQLEKIVRIQDANGSKPASETWLWSKWKEIKAARDEYLSAQRQKSLDWAKERGWEITDEFREQTERNCDFIYQWNREFETGRVKLKEFLTDGVWIYR